MLVRAVGHGSPADGPTGVAEGDAPIELRGSTNTRPGAPWTEEEAIQQTGSVFFSPEQLTDLTRSDQQQIRKHYVLPGQEFSDMNGLQGKQPKIY